ncbi:hypothetical protein AALP_AA4G003400 [Arabis alpina]|uniref:Pectinesterase inhibitor domain-containing protein n=1 Tax=Arabis alpina TaxID=50452 RepID=A0A087H085_ARAAL|nr:hypothetical protein AALP_AA4G003400 [Arabis alpina]
MMKMIKFLVLTLTLVVISPPISIYADKILMARECHNARFPTTCMQCLESDPTSLHATPYGIAGIVINCLESHLHILTNNITELLVKKQKGDTTKSALVYCKKYLTAALKFLPYAKTSLKNGKYDMAGRTIAFALMFPIRCEDILETAKFEKFEYPEIYNQINLYGQLSDAAMRIIDRF